ELAMPYLAEAGMRAEDLLARGRPPRRSRHEAVRDRLELVDQVLLRVEPAIATGVASLARVVGEPAHVGLHVAGDRDGGGVGLGRHGRGEREAGRSECEQRALDRIAMEAHVPSRLARAPAA